MTNGTYMTCPTPSVTSTIKLIDLVSNRRRRQVDRSINSESKKYSMTLKLDGLKKYQDPEWSRKNAVLTMSFNPVIKKFNNAKELKVYLGVNHTEIEVCVAFCHPSYFL